ncbi:NTPase [bacterium]|nr:NTPase [bacterium]
MSFNNKNLFLTGYPGVGKTTVIKEVVRLCDKIRFKGFYTSEIREKGGRTGFKINTFSGKSGVLSHKEIQSPYRVGKYRVSIEDLENIGVKELLHRGEVDVFVIDEIGKMEVFSEKFCKAVEDILNSNYPLIGTLSKKGSGFIKEVRNRNDVELIEVTTSNRNKLPAQICRRI